MAKPIPSTAVEAVLAALMPMTFPLKSMSAPPLLPGLMAASVWIKVLLIPFSSVISRSRALIYPTVTDWPYPRAFPMAMTCCPTLISSELPRVATLILLMVSEGISFNCTAMIARSDAESVPFTAALTSLLSTNVTFKSEAPSTTWLLVAMRSSVSVWFTMMPEPLLCAV